MGGWRWDGLLSHKNKTLSSVKYRNNGTEAKIFLVKRLVCVWDM